MKRLLVVTSVAIATASMAFAADIPAPAYKAPVAPVAFSWTGFYVGGHFGGMWGTKEWFEDATRTGSAGVEPAGFQDANYPIDGYFGGGQVGLNYQAGWAVFGVEADVAWADINGAGTNGCFLGVAGTAQTCSTRINALSTVTGRIGAAWDRYLLYITGGGAWAREKHANLCDVCFGTGGLWNATETRFGWVIGAGLEFAYERNWSIKIEFDYFDFGTQNLAFSASTPPGPIGNFTEDIRQRSYAIKTGINYRFDWAPPAAVSARY
jgi:outer membrane immunogenic protein